jgi:hypothetical protein
MITIRALCVQLTSRGESWSANDRARSAIARGADELAGGRDRGWPQKSLGAADPPRRDGRAMCRDTAAVAESHNGTRHCGALARATPGVMRRRVVAVAARHGGVARDTAGGARHGGGGGDCVPKETRCELCCVQFAAIRRHPTVRKIALDRDLDGDEELAAPSTSCPGSACPRRRACAAAARP